MGQSPKGSETGGQSQGGGVAVAQRSSVCHDCALLDRYLAGRAREMPCIICDRLWCEVTFKGSGQTLTGEEHVRSSGAANASIRMDIR